MKLTVEQLVRENQGLVGQVVKEFDDAIKDEYDGDIENEITGRERITEIANAGLLKAAELYSPQEEYKFEELAVMSIRLLIEDELKRIRNSLAGMAREIVKKLETKKKKNAVPKVDIG